MFSRENVVHTTDNELIYVFIKLLKLFYNAIIFIKKMYLSVTILYNYGLYIQKSF